MAAAATPNPVVSGVNNPGTSIFDALVANQNTTTPVLTLPNQATVPTTPVGAGALYASAGVPTFVDSAGNVVPLKNTAPGASDSSLLAWAFDPAVAAATFLTTAGVLHLTKVVLTSQQTITNGLISITTAGATLTSGQNFVALLNSAGTRVALSADQTTPFATAGLITAAFTTPITNAAPGTYYVAVLCNGTTPITLASGSALKPNNISIGNAGLATATSRFLTSGSALTAVPASVTLSSASGNIAGTIWAGIS